MADKELVAKGEDWARAQRQRLEQAANEKATQLRRIYNEHLEWFKTHTIEYGNYSPHVGMDSLPWHQN